MKWHVDKCMNDGVLRHSADSNEWNDFDMQHPKFALEPRNVRLVLQLMVSIRSETKIRWVVMFAYEQKYGGCTKIGAHLEYVLHDRCSCMPLYLVDLHLTKS